LSCPAPLTSKVTFIGIGAPLEAFMKGIVIVEVVSSTRKGDVPSTLVLLAVALNVAGIDPGKGAALG
jgi:hypothetical protein